MAKARPALAAACAASLAVMSVAPVEPREAGAAWPWVVICSAGGLELVNLLTGQRREPEDAPRTAAACHALAGRRGVKTDRLPG